MPVNVGNAEISPRDDYADVLRKILSQGLCPFCEEHLMKHHRKPILFRSAHWLVTENAWPYEGARQHVLLIPLVHVEAVEELTFAAWLDFLEVYRVLLARFELPGATHWFRSGTPEYTGASVNHLHAHLISGGPREEEAEPIRAIVAFKCR